MRNCDLLTYENEELMMAVIAFIDRDPPKPQALQHKYVFQTSE